jgi:hypothetical protein
MIVSRRIECEEMISDEYVSTIRKYSEMFGSTNLQRQKQSQFQVFLATYT